MSFDAIKFHLRNARDRLRIGIVESGLQSLNVRVKMLKRFAGVIPIDIAQRNDVLGCECDEVGSANTANSNRSNPAYCTGEAVSCLFALNGSCIGVNRTTRGRSGPKSASIRLTLSLG